MYRVRAGRSELPSEVISGFDMYYTNPRQNVVATKNGTLTTRYLDFELSNVCNIRPVVRMHSSPLAQATAVDG